MNRRLAFLVFALLLLALLWWAIRFTPPAPFYDEVRQHADAPLIPLDARREFVFEFDAPAARIRGIRFEYLFADPEIDVLLQVENRSQTTLLLREHLGQGYRHWARIPPSNERGDRIAVTFQVIRSRQDRFPAVIQALKRSASAPRYPVRVLSMAREKVSPGGEGRFPLFELRYHHPLRRLLWLWPVVLLGACFLHRREAPADERCTWLILTGLVAASTSFLLWAQACETDPSRRDPEGQLAYAESLSRRLGAGEGEPAGSAGIHPRAHFPLLPALAAVASATGVPVAVAFLWVCGLCSFGALLLFDFHLVHILQIRRRAALLLLLLLGTQVVFVSAFLLPAANPALACLSLAGCTALALRAVRGFPWQADLAFGLGLLAMSLAHPPGIWAALSFVGMAVIVDCIRMRGVSLTAQSRALEFYLIPAAVVYSLLALGSTWPQSMAALRAEALAHQHLSTWRQWWPPFLAAAHGLLAAAPGWRPRDARRIALLVPAGWIAFDLAASVRALEAFSLRSFLPVLPALHVLAAAGIHRLEANKPRRMLAVVLLIASANVWAAVILLAPETPLGSWLNGLLPW